jgi:rod shape determining protein RodA
MARRYDLQGELSLPQKLLHLSWGLIFLLACVACVGFTALYSAANGHLEPWASRQMMRFAVGVAGMIVVATIDIRLFHRFAYIIYGVCFVLLIIVESMGRIGMGAQRWIDLGFIQVQPSELMKIAVILALARYFHRAEAADMRRIPFLLPAAALVLAPVGLIALQPDLGTALMIGIASTGVFFIAGAPVWIFFAAFAAVAAAIPVGWHFMHDYQRQRVLTFLNPERDPLGAGYHITQSKIALGSGGVSGKGFLHGTQSHLNFLPEKQTDFIFTLWAEEWGLLGGLFLLGLFALIFIYGIWIALRCRHAFGRVVALGLTINFSVYVFVNIAMVMGLIPVVGAPLPLVSYGGTAMLAVLCGFGIVMSCNVYRDAKLSRF